jgi:hypothetical protein
MNTLLKYGCLGLALMLSACGPDVETIDLATVPDIPEDMVWENEAVSTELEADRKRLLEETNEQ